jgi:hypothetical protein
MNMEGNTNRSIASKYTKMKEFMTIK